MDTLIKKLTELNLTISTAESCTGGLISHTLTQVSGASKVFLLGVVTYSNESKSKVINVKPETLANFGAVSEQTAQEMANGVMKLAQSDISISVTGIAGPTGGTAEKPVGTVYICWKIKNKLVTQKFLFPGDRAAIQHATCDVALNHLIKILEKDTR